MWVALALLLAAGGPPDWQPPPPGAHPEAMAVTGVVRVRGVDLRSSSDLVAAFVDGEVRGVASPTLVGGRRVFFLSVAGSTGDAVLGIPPDGTVTFRAYDASADVVHYLTPELLFDPGAPVGTASSPLVWTPTSGEPPTWTVDPAAFEGSMTVTATVVDAAGGPVAETGTRLAAFVGDELRGVADVRTTSLGPRAFLTVYGGPGEVETLAFRVYRPGVGRVFGVAEAVAIDVGGSAGTV